MYLAGWGSDTGEMASPLKALIATPNRDKGMGATNAGRLLQPEGRRAARAGARDRGRRQARRAARRGEPHRHGRLRRVPLHFEMTTWAFKKDLAYKPRADQDTQATMVKRAQNTSRAVVPAKAGTLVPRTSASEYVPASRDDGV